MGSPWIWFLVFLGIYVIGAALYYACAPSAYPAYATSLLTNAKTSDRGRRSLAGPTPAQAAGARDAASTRTYGAANVVPDERAGNKLSDCAFNNLSANSKDDPILDVAKMFPSTTAFNKMKTSGTALDSFPVNGSTYLDRTRQAHKQAYVVRNGIGQASLKAARKAAQGGIGNGLRGQHAMFYSTLSKVVQKSKNIAQKCPEAAKMAMMATTNVPGIYLAAMAQGADSA